MKGEIVRNEGKSKERSKRGKEKYQKVFRKRGNSASEFEGNQLIWKGVRKY